MMWGISNGDDDKRPNLQLRWNYSLVSVGGRMMLLAVKVNSWTSGGIKIWTIWASCSVAISDFVLSRC